MCIGALVLFQNQRHHHSFVRHGVSPADERTMCTSQGINEAAEAAVVDSCNRILTCSQRNVFFQWRFLHVRILEFPLKQQQQQQQQQQHRWWKSTMKKRSHNPYDQPIGVNLKLLRWFFFRCVWVWLAFCSKYILKHGGKIWDLFILGPIFRVVFKCI